jgi:hypothetical protein
MSDRVLCERGGLWQPQRVFLKEVVRDFTDGANALATGVGEVVEAFLKFRRRFFSAIFARVFDADLLDSRMRRPANQNSYHQMSPRWKRLMFSLLSMPTAEGGTDRPNIEEHFLWAVLCGTLNRNKAVFCIPIHPVAISIRNEAAAANFLGYPKRNLERFRNQRVSQTLARETFVNA